MSVLKIRDENGNFIPIKSIKGESAYEQAKAGGYLGTEEEFIQALASLGGEYALQTINDGYDEHIDDRNNPHKVTAEQVGALPLTGGIMKGKIEWNDGKTHVVGQGDGNFIVRNYKTSEDGNDDFLAFHNILPLNSVLRVYRNGVPYSIYGQHNKPTAKDVGALPVKLGDVDSTLKVELGNHNYIHNKYDGEVPEMPVISNFTHYITFREDGKVTAVLSVPIDYTNKAYYYTFNDKKWHEIAEAENNAKYASGTYVGTGGGGVEKPNSITFPFKPKMVFISIEGRTDRIDTTLPFVYGSGIGLVYSSESTNWATHSTYPLNLIWSDKTLTWTYTLNSSGIEQHQLNIKDAVYNWVAIG